ncbi:fad-dependent isoamyl alcohol [Ilyonectria robusta]
MDPLYEGDWKGNMYGSNYERLLSIKHKYDPHRLMYAHFAVGADEFTFDEGGRLCVICEGASSGNTWNGGCSSSDNYLAEL